MLNSDKILKAWVKALKSGKYKQTKGALKRKTSHGIGYCCLGVLCSIVEGAEFDKQPDAKGEYSVYYGGHSSVANLPDPIAQQLGITNNEEGILIDMNDGDKNCSRKKFSTIATWIEKNIIEAM